MVLPVDIIFGGPQGMPFPVTALGIRALGAQHKSRAGHDKKLLHEHERIEERILECSLQTL